METKLYAEMYRQEKTYWWHVAKRQLVRPYISGKKVLDVGCGTGAMMSELKENGFDAYGLDGSDDALKFCQQRGLENLKKADFEKPLPYPVGTFDTVLCLDVLEHIGRDDRLLTNMHKVLKPGGRLIITVPAYQKFWTYWDEMVGHKRRYELAGLSRLVKRTGFKLEKASYYNCPLTPAFIVRWIRNKQDKRSSDFVDVPPLVNDFLLFSAAVERLLMRFVNMPFGVSIIIVSQRTGETHTARRLRR